MTTQLLFVCLGNICRSPTAEGVMRQKVALAGRTDIVCDSAGTSRYHIGAPSSA
ncbi:MAG: low molecular weight phosphotyrosine protein phosphatase, partial [Synechococcaceae cyanobacterium SM2_3_60]|nr:low molecular weight phosphotyrosine protein phosphatase [Synechococcaceae cyanobacterium SM2_3_60]